MRNNERIKVFIKYENGKPFCMCKASHKLCNSQKCEKEIVELDRYRGLEEVFRQDRYGKCHFK